jgi:hypothetical protein
MVVAIVALVFAVAGSAVAGVATVSVLSKKEKKQTRNIAKDEINKAAPGLSVKSATNATNATSATNATNATNADTVGGKTASALQTSSGFNQNISTIASLGATFVTVASATITTHTDGRVLATASAELVGADADEVGQCKITIDGVDSGGFFDAAPDDIGTNNQFVIAVNFARLLPAGTHTATLDCRAVLGTVGKNDASINVYGLGP